VADGTWEANVGRSARRVLSEGITADLIEGLIVTVEQTGRVSQTLTADLIEGLIVTPEQAGRVAETTMTADLINGQVS
jgi:hypothetical protein